VASDSGRADARSGQIDNTPWSLAFDRSTRQLVIGFQDGSVRVLDLDRGIWTDIGHHDRAVCAVDWAPDGQLLLSGSLDWQVKLWAAPGSESAAPVDPLKHNSAVHTASFSADGRRIVTGADDTNVRVWDVARGTAKLLEDQHHTVRAAVFGPDGTWVLSGAGNLAGLSCLPVQNGESSGPCEPGADMVLVNSPGNSREDLRFVRALDVAPGQPQFALVDETGILSLYRTDYRTALWQQQPNCLSPAGRQTLLGEPSPQAERNHRHCQEITQQCGQSFGACRKILDAVP
jgi:hypothetical protein